MKNGFVVGLRGDARGERIDPGDEVELLLEAAGSTAWSIRYILLTHAHLDHITGVGAGEEALGVPVGLHQDDRPSVSRHGAAGTAFGFASAAARRWTSTTAGTSSASAATTCGHHTPGHCPGGVCLAVAEPGSERTLFVGDTLFAGSIGRTDLPGGDLETLLRSIREVLFRFPTTPWCTRPRRADDDRPREADESVPFLPDGVEALPGYPPSGVTSTRPGRRPAGRRP